MILALDISTTTGWALSDGRTGTVDFSEYKNDRPRLLRRYYGWLCAQADRFNVMYIVVEAPFFRGPHSRLFGSMVDLAHVCADERGFDSSEVAPTSLKKHATGSGNASKDDMIAAAKALGWKVEDDHQADAALLIEWHHAQQREAA